MNQYGVIGKSVIKINQKTGKEVVIVNCASVEDATKKAEALNKKVKAEEIEARRKKYSRRKGDK